jgi:hypothetical protein
MGVYKKLDLPQTNYSRLSGTPSVSGTGGTNDLPDA